jgi:hypothetical protein
VSVATCRGDSDGRRGRRVCAGLHRHSVGLSCAAPSRAATGERVPEASPSIVPPDPCGDVLGADRADVVLGEVPFFFRLLVGT